MPFSRNRLVMSRITHGNWAPREPSFVFLISRMSVPASATISASFNVTGLTRTFICCFGDWCSGFLYIMCDGNEPMRRISRTAPCCGYILPGSPRKYFRHGHGSMDRSENCRRCQCKSIDYLQSSLFAVDGNCEGPPAGSCGTFCCSSSPYRTARVIAFALVTASHPFRRIHQLDRVPAIE